MLDLSSLNKNQKAAVYTNSQYVLVVAGAGSGKTKVLTSRISYLISECGVFPGNILAITFTNKAANEMKDRIFSDVADQARKVWISTIHSLCVRILREDIGILGWPRNFTVLDGEDQRSLLKQAYNDLGLDKQKYPFGMMLDYIGNNKGADISVEHAYTLAGKLVVEREKAKVYEYYVNKCQNQFYLDFDDLLLMTVKLFKQSAHTKGKWQSRFQYIHVDEFQDVDGVQYQLLLALKGQHNHIYVVGDPDQTIYTWRGADVKHILSFEKDFAPCEIVILNENYRSTPTILDGANSLIKHNKYRVEKDLFSNKEVGSKIKHIICETEDQEMRWITQSIREKHKNGLAYKDQAILYRSNYLSRAMEKSLRDFGIPYIIYGGIRFYDRAEVKDMLSYLRLIAISDDLAFLRAINTPKRGLGEKTIGIIRELADSKGLNLYEASKDQSILSGKARKSMNEFIDLIEQFKEKVFMMPLDKMMEELLLKSGIKSLLQQEKETDRLENIKELMRDATDFIERYPDSDLVEYLQMVSLYGDKAEMLQSDYVQLMTVHAAKGLEFDTVYMISMSEGVFPNERSMAEGKLGLEEERRLAYVAMTRAKHHLILSHSYGYSYVLNKPKTPSRFIQEIDENFIEVIHAVAKSPIMESNSFILDMEQGEPLIKKIDFKKGDVVAHTTFGDGIVIDIDGMIATIAFDYPFGVKNIVATHPSLQKKGRSLS